jgi:multiple sugar transport system substrate-binding protein
MPRNRLRWVTVMSVLVAVMALAAACSGGGQTGADGSTLQPGQKVDLQFWSWVPGIDAAVNLWNQRHPDIHVTLAKIPSGSSGGYAKMHAALAAGTAPDLAQVEYQEIPSFLLDNGLADLSKYGADQDKNKFVPWQWQQGVFGGQVYAIPQASGPMGLFYRADLFARYGITSPPATWAEYEQDALKIHQADPGVSIGTFPPGNSAWFTSLAWQAGANWFGTSGDSWTVNIDSPQTEQVAAYWDRLRAEGVIKTEPDFANGWYKDLQTGAIAGWISASWGDAILEDNAPNTAGDWKVAPLPQWTAGGTASANWGGSSTAVLSDSRHPAQALQFATWLNSDPQSIALLIKGGYGWPAATGGYVGTSLDQPSSFFGNQKYNDVFAASDKHINESWKWIPTIDQAYQHLDDGFSAAVNGNGSFVAAVRQAQGQVVADMKAKGLKVVAGR